MARIKNPSEQPSWVFASVLSTLLLVACAPLTSVRKPPPTDVDISQAVKVRNATIDAYNSSNFTSAYNQLLPLDFRAVPPRVVRPELPERWFEQANWWNKFRNVGDVQMLQILSAHEGDKRFFEYVSDDFGLGNDKCVSIVRAAANDHWGSLQLWAQCHGKNNRNPAQCAAQRKVIADKIPAFDQVFGPPSGFCTFKN